MHSDGEKTRYCYLPIMINFIINLRMLIFIKIFGDAREHAFTWRRIIILECVPVTSARRA
jgi:hypothetical protein